MPLLRDTINIYNYQFVASVNMVAFFSELMAKLTCVFEIAEIFWRSHSTRKFTKRILFVSNLVVLKIFSLKQLLIYLYY